MGFFVGGCVCVCVCMCECQLGRRSYDLMLAPSSLTLAKSGDSLLLPCLWGHDFLLSACVSVYRTYRSPGPFLPWNELDEGLDKLLGQSWDKHLFWTIPGWCASHCSLVAISRQQRGSQVFTQLPVWWWPTVPARPHACSLPVSLFLSIGSLLFFLSSHRVFSGRNNPVWK